MIAKMIKIEDALCKYCGNKVAFLSSPVGFEDKEVVFCDTCDKTWILDKALILKKYKEATGNE